MSDFAYVILKDYEYDRDPQMGDNAGTYGPADITPIQKERVVRGEPFLLYNENGQPAQAGRCLCSPADDTGYGPMEDFGAAEIRFRDHAHNGKWVPLG